MARRGKSVDGLEGLIDFFPASTFKYIERLLQRAADKAARQAGANARHAMLMFLRSGVARNRAIGVLADELAKALRVRGDLGRGRPSLRARSPTGGRPFHFAHSVAHRSGSTDAIEPSAEIGRKPKLGNAAAHMRYVERDGAIERVALKDRRDGRVSSPDRDTDNGSQVHEIGHGGTASGHASAAAPGQRYVEDDGKVESAGEFAASFGTIGDTPAERVAFWEALEDAEPHPNARVQHRLIVELPHEATPATRVEIMKTFCAKFEKDHVPYWAALHAPTAKNDSRNFHAHIVYSERPAVKRIDPDNKEKGLQWDFAIIKHYKTKSRNRKQSRPFRQSKLRTYHDLNFIRSLRQEFSEIANKVLERDDVRDAAGKGVRYDARSYVDMGLDCQPLRSINRIAADRMKDGEATILDGAYTQRMIAAELHEAAVEGDKALGDLLALQKTFDDLLASRSLAASLRALPRSLRGMTLNVLSRPELRVASRRILDARGSAVQIDVMARATTASLNRVIDATAPRADAASKTNDPSEEAEGPLAEAAALLRETALEELSEMNTLTAQARKAAKSRIKAAVSAWGDLVNAPAPSLSPTLKLVRKQDEEREACQVRAHEREARDPRNNRERVPTLSGDAAAPAVSLDAQSGFRHADPAKEPPGRSEAPNAPLREQKSAKPEAKIDLSDPPNTETHKPPPRPLTLEKVGACKMPEMPRMPEMQPVLVDISATISGWIKTIANSSDDVGVRMASLDAFKKSLLMGHREMRAITESLDDAAVKSASFDGSLKSPSEISEVSPAPERSASSDTHTARGATSATTPRTVQPPDGTNQRSGLPAGRSDTAVDAQPEQTSAGATPSSASATATSKRRRRSGRDHEDGQRDVPRAQPRPRSGESTPLLPPKAPVPQEQSMPAYVPEVQNVSEIRSPEALADDTPDYARRRRKHDQEVKKNKRKAVLARRNRGRTR